jgi:hypothetical protein
MYLYLDPASIKYAALAHLGERQTEVHFKSRITANSGGTVFDPQKRHTTLSSRASITLESSLAQLVARTTVISIIS